MIPSVKERQKGAFDFKTFYEGVCDLQNVVPLPSVTCHLPEGILDINVDRIRTPDWDPIFKSLRINKNLNFVAFRSFASATSGPDRSGSYRRPTPALLASATMKRTLCRAVRSTLRLATALTYLELQNIPINLSEVKLLSEGITQNRTLRHLSFEGSRIGDDGLQELCRAIRITPELTTLNLTACKISSHGIEYLTELIKFQAMQRHGAAWADSLRYRQPNLDQLGGLRRITLNDNPDVGDAGAISMAEALADDLWVKAVDMQSCGLSDSSARVWLSILVGPRIKVELSGLSGNAGNRSLFVLDLRRNPLIARDLLRAVTERALMNAEGKQTEYNWLRANPQAPTHLCSGVVVYPWPGITGFQMSHLQKRSSSRSSGPVPVNQTQRQKSFAPASARSHSGSRIERQHSAAHDGRLSGRPVFIPAGGKLRSRSLTSVKYTPDLCHRRHSSTRSLQYQPIQTRRKRSSGTPSARAPWRPAGKSRPSTALETDKPRQRMMSAGGGIPWRTAARASRCCRGYPHNQHPGQTCLEARSMRLIHPGEKYPEITDSIPSAKRPLSSGVLQRYRVLEPHSALSTAGKLGWIGPNEVFQKPLIKTAQVVSQPAGRLQNQVNKLMRRVAQLEIELAKEKNKAQETRKHSKKPKDQLNVTPQRVIQPYTIERLNGFLQNLQELMINLNRHGIEVGHQESSLEHLKANLHNLCDLVDQVTRQVVAGPTGPGSTGQSALCDGDRPSHDVNGTPKWTTDEGHCQMSVSPSQHFLTLPEHSNRNDQSTHDPGGDMGHCTDADESLMPYKPMNESYTEHQAVDVYQSAMNNIEFKAESEHQTNNHNSDNAATSDASVIATGAREEPTGCARPTDFSQNHLNSEVIEKSDIHSAQDWSHSEARECQLRSFNSLKRLERLTSEADRMYAELKAATGAHSCQEDLNRNQVQLGTDNQGNSSTATNNSWHKKSKTSSCTRLTNFPSRIRNSGTINPTCLPQSHLDDGDDDDDDEMISDDEENLKLWSISSHESCHSTPGRLERGPKLVVTNAVPRQNFQRPSTSLDDTELTIRENVFTNSDEELDDLLIDYSLGVSDDDTSETDQQNEPLFDICDLALSDSRASTEQCLATSSKRNRGLLAKS